MTTIQMISRSPVGLSPRERVEWMSIPEPTSGCWLWLANISNSGHGSLMIGEKFMLAHRYSYAAFVGPLVPKMLICHKCNNPVCVNPDHLYQGTYEDNSSDAIRAGRKFYSILTPDEVENVLKDDRPAKDVANDYGCGRHIIYSIRSKHRPLTSPTI